MPLIRICDTCKKECVSHLVGFSVKVCTDLYFWPYGMNESPEFCSARCLETWAARWAKTLGTKKGGRKK